MHATHWWLCSDTKNMLVGHMIYNLIKTNKPYTLLHMNTYYNCDAPSFPRNSTLRWMVPMVVFFPWKKAWPQKSTNHILSKQIFHGVQEKWNICVIKRECAKAHYLPFVQECKGVPNDHLASTHCEILHLCQSTHQPFVVVWVGHSSALAPPPLSSHFIEHKHKFGI